MQKITYCCIFPKIVNFLKEIKISIFFTLETTLKLCICTMNSHCLVIKKIKYYFYYISDIINFIDKSENA